jgi:hypothetical protein
MGYLEVIDIKLGLLQMLELTIAAHRVVSMHIRY